jgi:formylmethanofuran:tetrahydromethanopterin formyltransferase
MTTIECKNVQEFKDKICELIDQQYNTVFRLREFTTNYDFCVHLKGVLEGIENISEFIKYIKIIEINGIEVNVVINSLKQGKLIDAIKLYRQVTGAFLKEAKEACERARDKLASDPNWSAPLREW